MMTKQERAATVLSYIDQFGLRQADLEAASELAIELHAVSCRFLETHKLVEPLRVQGAAVALLLKTIDVTRPEKQG